MESMKKCTVVVTGFGVFRNYSSNPSWEAVSRLNLEHHPSLEIIKIQVPVVYEAAEKEVARIWEQYQPDLVIHCGVSRLATCLTLEKRAVENVERYCSPDVNSCKPQCEEGKHLSEDQQQHLKYLYTGFDLEKVAHHVSEQSAAGRIPIDACVSTRAGEYVCEYIYRCSLKRNAQRTLFVHVPEVGDEGNDGLTADKIARGLEVLIETVLHELNLL